MAVPTTDNNAARAAERIRQLAKNIRSDAIKYIAQCDLSAVNAHDLVNSFAYNHLVPSIAEWGVLRIVTGVQEALMTMFKDNWANVAAVTTDLTNAETAMNSTLTYIVTNTPKDGSNFALTLTVNATSFAPRIITAGGAITPLRAQLVTLRDAFS